MVGATMGPEQLWRQLLALLRDQCLDDATVTASKQLLRRERIDIYDLDGFFRLAATRGQRVVFLLDEFDQVTANANFGPDFYFGFRSLAIHRKVALVTASRLELVELCHSESVKSSPFFNIFANINLRLFSAEEAQTLVSRSLCDASASFTDRETRQVTDLAGHHPYFLQMACYQLFEAYRQGLDTEGRKGFLADQFRAEAVPHFVDLWASSGDPRKIALTAAALLECQAGQSPEFTLEALQRVYPRAGPNLAVLEQRGLVLRADGGYRLFSSALAPWIVDQIVAERDDQESFRDWLAQDKVARSKVRGRQNRPLREVLPQIGPRYRQLILAWASDPQSVVAMAGLLKSVLNTVS